ncbi:MAG TPA: site-2 protease family protein [Gemmatimonadaceae bacterium]|nr:site-2 protease family protein [Gemmatimonadaceae bacterium]
MAELDNFLLAAPVLLFSMVAHEYAHGYAALKQGDPTAQQLGRLTWNPIKHIDPFLTILMPVITYMAMGFIFGGAKPVPVNPRNYRNYRRGDIIVSLAGVATNLVLFPLFALIIVGLGLLGRAIPSAVNTLALLQGMMWWGVLFNLLLAVFNLIPIPPLDGSHVMKWLLPPTWSLRYQQLGKYGIIVLLLLFWTDAGKNALSAVMFPVRALGQPAFEAVLPFFLKSPSDLGIL